MIQNCPPREGPDQPPVNRFPEPMTGERLEQTRALISGQLRESRYPTLRNVQCEIQGDAIVLQGRVPTFYAKQVAQELLRSVEPSVRIDNQLEVS